MTTLTFPSNQTYRNASDIELINLPEDSRNRVAPPRNLVRTHNSTFLKVVKIAVGIFSLVCAGLSCISFVASANIFSALAAVGLGALAFVLLNKEKNQNAARVQRVYSDTHQNQGSVFSPPPVFVAPVSSYTIPTRPPTLRGGSSNEEQRIQLGNKEPQATASTAPQSAATYRGRAATMSSSTTPSSRSARPSTVAIDPWSTERRVGIGDQSALTPSLSSLDANRVHIGDGSSQNRHVAAVTSSSLGSSRVQIGERDTNTLLSAQSETNRVGLGDHLTLHYSTVPQQSANSLHTSNSHTTSSSPYSDDSRRRINIEQDEEAIVAANNGADNDPERRIPIAKR